MHLYIHTETYINIYNVLLLVFWGFLLINSKINNKYHFTENSLVSFLGQKD